MCAYCIPDSNNFILYFFKFQNIIPAMYITIVELGGDLKIFKYFK